MDLSAVTPTLGIAEASAAEYRWSVPRWVKAVDRAVIVLLNVVLAVEVVLIFANTMARTLFNSSALMGVDETSSLFLITLAFLAARWRTAAASSSPSRCLVDRAPARWNAFFKAAAEWMVILIAVLHRRLLGSAAARQCEEKSDPPRHQLCVDDVADHAGLRALRDSCRVRLVEPASRCHRDFAGDRRRAGGRVHAVQAQPGRPPRRALWGLLGMLFFGADRDGRCRSDSCSPPSASSACRRPARPT